MRFKQFLTEFKSKNLQAGKQADMMFMDARVKPKHDGQGCVVGGDTLQTSFPRLRESTNTDSALGRSMIEMLGVLAIMGVLSIGGIAGYNYAIDKYRANETIDELNKRAVVYATQVLNNAPKSGEILKHGEFGNKTALGYDVEANNSYYPNEFEVTLKNYPSEVCRDILKNYMIPYQIVVAGKVYDPDSDNYGICGEDGDMAPETLFVYTADLNQEKEDGDELEGTNPEDVCVKGEEFYSYGQCYPCDSNGSYGISSEGEYDLCRACGRRMAVEGYCVPGCMAGQVYHMGQKKCVTPECVTNSDCGSGKYCKLDSTQNGNSCTEAPTSGTCVSTTGTAKTVSGVGTYQKSSDPMDWWNAQNYCQAIGGRMASVSDFNCGYDYVGANKNGYCNTDTTTSSSGTRSAAMQAFQTAFGKSNWYWMSDSYSACYAYGVDLSDGYVNGGNRDYNHYALCRVGD